MPPRNKKMSYHQAQSFSIKGAHKVRALAVSGQPMTATPPLFSPMALAPSPTAEPGGSEHRAPNTGSAANVEEKMGLDGRPLKGAQPRPPAIPQKPNFLQGTSSWPIVKKKHQKGPHDRLPV